MDVLDGRSVVALGNHELLPALDELDAEITERQGLRLQVIARMEEAGHAQELGARDTVELLSLRHRQDRAEAWRDVRLARALPKYAAVDNALTNGIDLPTHPSESGDSDPEAARAVRPMRTAHASAIVSELERVRTRVPVEDLDVAEEELVALAAHLAPKELRSAARQLCNLLDSDGPEPEEQKAYARESLTLTRADNGVKFKGYLANENAELLSAVVHAGARPHRTTDGELDPRPRDKRQADALTTALTLAANAWDTNTPAPAHGAGSPAGQAAASSGVASAAAAGSAAASSGESAAESAADSGAAGRGGWVPGYGAKANITVTIDLEDLKAATADAIGHTVYSDGLSAATIRRLACDANIIPLVLGSNSEPLDVGRRERLVTKALRHALNARDRGCVVCGAPPVMCDAHHLISWIEGGETSIDNLALLCRRHHTDLHNGRWTITITNGVVHVARPTWADPPPLYLRKPSPVTARAPEPPTEESAHSERPVGKRTHPGPPVEDPACPGVDHWGGTPLPAPGAIGARTSRWKADEATLADAARFAVWGHNTPAESDTGPPSFATI